MSRAFVKEPDGDQAPTELIEKPISSHPNYMTPRGLEQMKLRFDELRRQQQELRSRTDDLAASNQLRHLEMELRYLEKRIQTAIPVDIANHGGDRIRFGATVELVDPEGRRYSFTIVGEDEADADQGLISWISPLARALLGREIGEVVTWQRPAGDLDLEITGFSYAA
jgi:transcription elongation GreA/GreB family factor